MNKLILVLLALTACTQKGGDGTTLTQTLDSEVTQVDALISAHVTAVSAAPDLATVATLEAQHQTDMTAAMEAMTTTMDAMMACGMESMMGDAQTHMDEMMTRMSDHVSMQTSAKELSACMPEESSYQTDMSVHMEAMSGMSTDSGGMMGASCETGMGM